MDKKMTMPPQTCPDCCESPTGDVWLCKKHAAQPALLEACRGLLAHLWDDRKRNVKRDFSLMVAEVAAQKAIALTTDKERE